MAWSASSQEIGTKPGSSALAFAGIGTLHRRTQTVGVVRLLNEPQRLDADPAIGRMDAGGREVRQDFRGHAVHDLDFKEIRAGYAIVAIAGNPSHLWVAPTAIDSLSSDLSCP